MVGSIGPHEGRELELMKAGAKPLSMFVESVEPNAEHFFSENDFDQLVAEGKLLKHSSLETIGMSYGKDTKIRRVLYALPSEGWRINAILLVQDVYSSLGGGWRTDLDRIIGHLLGYDNEDIEYFVNQRLPTTTSIDRPTG